MLPCNRKANRPNIAFSVTPFSPAKLFTDAVGKFLVVGHLRYDPTFRRGAAGLAPMASTQLTAPTKTADAAWMAAAAFARRLAILAIASAVDRSAQAAVARQRTRR